MARADLTRLISNACGASTCTINELGNGWPSKVTINLGEEQLSIAAHVSVIGAHARHDYEMRFQNPGDRSPVSAPGGCHPLLIGVAQNADAQPILVVVDGTSRVGREARFSILFNRRIIDEARSQGWSTYNSATGERMVAVLPSLLPLAVAEIFSGFRFASSDVTLLAAGLYLEESPPSEANAERLRRTTSTLVRDYRFGRDVVSAYGGQCAMCGLDFGLVVGAHIFPASAPSAPDHTWNGLCLCQNHHAAFDRHIIWVKPAPEHEIVFHPKILEDAAKNLATKKFIESTSSKLSPACDLRDKPQPEMFEKRYQYYSEEYEWVGAH